MICRSPSLREFAFLRALLAQLGMPYGWNLKGLPGEDYQGRDCSGAVTWALMTAGGPDLRATHWSQRMWNDWAETELIRPGTVALYGADGEHVAHVMASLWDGAVVGAAGGDKSVTTIEKARQRDAAVKLKRSHLYRKDFLGWRRLPWIDEGDTP